MQNVREIEEQIIAEFKRLKKAGDVKKIADATGMSTQSVYNLLALRKFNEDLFKYMVGFYKERKAFLENSLNDLKSIQ